MTILYLYLILLCYNASLTVGNPICLKPEFVTELDTIVAESGRDFPPAESILVELGISIRHVTVLEADSTAHIVLDMYLSWQNTRIEWNRTRWDCEATKISVERLWQPDVTVLNNDVSIAPIIDPMPASVDSNGNINTVTRLDILFPIETNLVDWPSDVQEAVVVFGSRTMTNNQLVLQFKDRKTKTMFSNGDGVWRIKSTNMRSTTQLTDIGDSHDTLMLHIKVQRHAPAHSLATSAVFVAVLVQLIASTILPPDSRIPLCACASFTAALWLMSILPRLPHASTTPIVLSLISAICITSCVAGLAAAVVCRVARMKSTPPTIIRSLLIYASGLCSLTPDESTSAAACGAWVAASKLLDKTIIVMLLVTLVIIVCVYSFG